MNERSPTGDAAAAAPSAASPIAPEPGNLPGALMAALIAALVGAVLWALITVLTKMQIGFMAVGVGFLVAWAVRRFGRGVEPVYGFIGAAFALFGCVLGNLFSACAIAAVSADRGILEVAGQVLGDAGLIARVMQTTFQPMDLLFYAIAVYEGFRLARRPSAAAAAPPDAPPAAS